MVTPLLAWLVDAEQCTGAVGQGGCETTASPRTAIGEPLMVVRTPCEF